MISLPPNELLKVVHTIEAERRREAANARRIDPRETVGQSERRPQTVPLGGRRDPGGVPERRPLSPSAGASSGAAGQLPTF